MHYDSRRCHYYLLLVIILLFAIVVRSSIVTVIVAAAEVIIVNSNGTHRIRGLHVATAASLCHSLSERNVSTHHSIISCCERHGDPVDWGIGRSPVWSGSGPRSMEQSRGVHRVIKHYENMTRELPMPAKKVYYHNQSSSYLTYFVTYLFKLLTQSLHFSTPSLLSELNVQ